MKSWLSAIAILLIPLPAWPSVTVSVNGTNYSIPQTNEKGWGNNVTSWIQAITSNTLQPNSGLFTLSAELDFGSGFGIKSLYWKSRSTNPSNTGVLRLANGDAIGFRNSGNSGDLLLTPGASDGLINYNGVALDTVSLSQTLSNKTLLDTSTVFANASDTTKQLKLLLSGATTSTTVTLASNQTASRTLTLPDATDTLVARATTDTLTNKTIAVSSNTISGTSSKAAEFSGGGALQASVFGAANSSGTATAVVGTDANANIQANNVVESYATTATAAGTTALTAASAKIQYFTGSSTQTVKMPDATTLPKTGFQFFIVNLSTGAVTVQDNGGNTIQVMAASSYTTITAKSISTANGSWDSSYALNAAGGGTVTNVAMTVPTGFTISGSPITVAGTLAVSSNGQPGDIFNCGISASISTSQLVVALKQSDGATDATLASPCSVQFRNATASVGGYSYHSFTAASSITLATNSSIGTIASTAFDIYVYLIVDSTSEICLSRSWFDQKQLQSATANAAGVTSATTLYCPSSHTSRPIRLIGKLVGAVWSNPNWAAPTTVAIDARADENGCTHRSGFVDQCIEAANVTVGTACATNSQSGNWLGSHSGCGAAGASTVAINSGIFSGTPACDLISGSGSTLTCNFTAQSSTSLTLVCFASQTGTNANSASTNLKCMGPR